MQWTIHGERTVYESSWLRLALADVELPDGTRLDHHVIRTPQPAAGTVVHDADRGVLLIWRHRFIPDHWGHEIPAGRIEAGEEPIDAARREVLEETGWDVDDIEPLVSFHPTSGLSDQTFHLFIAEGARHIGDPSDPTEAERVEWMPVAELAARIGRGEMWDGLSLTGLTFALAIGRLQPSAGEPG